MRSLPFPIPAKSFTLVFPSNAQQERYANTAASYQTDLETPIDLAGRWEVALQDLSYVNSIKTHMNESVILAHVQTGGC